MKIRGSIPLFWSQPETWKLKPLIVPITDLSKHSIALKTHLLDLVKYYIYKGFPFFKNDSVKDELPAIIMINLIDKHGSQGKLGTSKQNKTKQSKTKQNNKIKININIK